MSIWGSGCVKYLTVQRLVLVSQLQLRSVPRVTPDALQELQVFFVFDLKTDTKRISGKRSIKQYLLWRLWDVKVLTLLMLSLTILLKKNSGRSGMDFQVPRELIYFSLYFTWGTEMKRMSMGDQRAWIGSTATSVWLVFCCWPRWCHLWTCGGRRCPEHPCLCGSGPWKAQKSPCNAAEEKKNSTWWDSSNFKYRHIYLSFYLIQSSFKCEICIFLHRRHKRKKRNTE